MEEEKKYYEILLDNARRYLSPEDYASFLKKCQEQVISSAKAAKAERDISNLIEKINQKIGSNKKFDEKKPDEIALGIVSILYK